MNIIRKVGQRSGFKRLRELRASAGIGVFGAPHLGRPRAQRHRQSGQAMLEYALLIATTIVFSVGLLATFNSRIRDGIFAFNVALERDLETGRLRDEGIWSEDF